MRGSCNFAIPSTANRWLSRPHPPSSESLEGLSEGLNLARAHEFLCYRRAYQPWQNLRAADAIFPKATLGLKAALAADPLAQ